MRTPPIRLFCELATVVALVGCAHTPEPRPEPRTPNPDLQVTPQMNQVYELERMADLVVAGTQGGVVIWDEARRIPLDAHREFICNSVVVWNDAAWAGCDKSVLRWEDGTWTSFLANDDNDAKYYRLLTGPDGELIASYGSNSWIFDVEAAAFVRTPRDVGGGSYDAIFHRKKLWRIAFLSALHGPHGPMPRGSQAYPGKDPRRLRVDATGRLWVEDFVSGLFRFDEASKTFRHEAGLEKKGTGVVVDSRNDRLWMLHYTRGLTLKRRGRIARTIDLSDLRYMRDIEGDSDGSVWVAGWTGFVRIRVDGDEVVRDDYKLTPK